jgi:diguanylate cyclase (GGDEF)-like protein/PAS domain S-box-containing protein
MAKAMKYGQLEIHSSGIIEAIHRSISGILGVQPREVIGKQLETFIHELSKQTFLNDWNAIKTGNSEVFHCFVVHGSGAVLPAEIACIETEENGKLLLSLKDLSLRRDLESELLAMREQYELLSETTTDVILQINNDMKILYANSAVEKVFGYQQSELVQKDFRILFPKSQYERYEKTIRKYFVIDETHRENSGMRNVIEVLARNTNGDMIPVEISLGNSKGVGTGRILTCIVRDITLRKKADRRLHYLAYHDKLTSLGNRDRFTESLNRVLKECIKDKTKHAALLYLDLDGFKKINDSLGHEIGDAILKACAKRLGNCLRDGDQVYRFDFEEIFRLGGDEFTILLPIIKKPEDASIVARRVIDTLTQPFSIEGWESIKNIRLGVSIGIALVPRDGTDKTALLRNADSAMYKAKEKGNSYVFFTEEMNDMAMERLLMEEGIRRALGANEFELYFQPIVDSTGVITSAEALIRWNHPKHGLLLPDRFIPLAEDIDLIKPLGTWVLSAACKQLKSLHDLGFDDLAMAVNLAPAQLDQRDLSDTIGNIISRSGLKPSDLRLELTETTIMENPERSRQKIEMIKAMNNGITVAIDDFGTGYSSLAYLTRYAVDFLKIDRSFVIQMDDGDNSKVIQTIINLGKGLGLGVVAEGVETEEQFKKLAEYGCGLYQGYYFHQPMAFDALCTVLSEKKDS